MINLSSLTSSRQYKTGSLCKRSKVFCNLEKKNLPTYRKMSKFGDLFASRDSEHHYGQKAEMLGSTGFAHEANPHRVCVASAQQPQKKKSNPYVYIIIFTENVNLYTHFYVKPVRET